MSRIFYHTAFTSSSEESVQAIPLAVIKLVAIIIVSIISILNAFSNSLGRKTQVITTAAKLVALVAVAIVGIVQLARGKSSDSLKGNTFVGASTSPGHYALALYSGLWAFDGWDQVNFVTSELKEPTKDLPKVIHSSVSHSNEYFDLVADEDLASNCVYRIHDCQYFLFSCSTKRAGRSFEYSRVGELTRVRQD